MSHDVRLEEMNAGRYLRAVQAQCSCGWLGRAFLRTGHRKAAEVREAARWDGEQHAGVADG